MSKLTDTGTTRRYAYLLAMLLSIGAWQLGEIVTQRMARLPVKAAPQVNHKGKTMDPKQFYPVWVKQAVANAPVGDTSNVDAFFRKEEPVKQNAAPAPTPAEPDYVALFQGKARVDGVSDNGVFINGYFFKVGDKLEAFSMPAPQGDPIVPVLESIHSGVMVFRIGEKPLRFRYKEKA